MREPNTPGAKLKDRRTLDTFACRARKDGAQNFRPSMAKLNARRFLNLVTRLIRRDAPQLRQSLEPARQHVRRIVKQLRFRPRATPRPSAILRPWESSSAWTKPATARTWARS